MLRPTVAGIRVLVGATAAMLVVSALPAAAAPADTSIPAKAARLLWDDFGAGTHPSTTFWSHRNYPAINQGTCKRNATEPYKRSRSRSNNSVAKVGGGNLRLLAQERPCKNRPRRAMHYTGQIGTEGKVHLVPGTASVFTVSAKITMPKTSGNFASLWTRSPGGAGDPQEIDIVESFGARAGCKLRTNYYPRYDTDAGEKSVCLDGRRHVPARPWAAFHTYTAVWRPGLSMTIKIDGHRVHKFGKAYTPTLTQFVILSNLLNDKASIKGKKSGSSMVVAWVHATAR